MSIVEGGAVKVEVAFWAFMSSIVFWTEAIPSEIEWIQVSSWIMLMGSSTCGILSRVFVHVSCWSDHFSSARSSFVAISESSVRWAEGRCSVRSVEDSACLTDETINEEVSSRVRKAAACIMECTVRVTAF